MKIVNYNNSVQLGVKNFKNNENKETTTQTFKYKTNPNVSYAALNSSFFNNQKLLIKNTKLKNCPISFKANPDYEVSMLHAIRNFYYGCGIAEMNLPEVVKLGNDLLSNAKKTFEENIKEEGFPVLKIDPKKSTKENKNILNSHLKKLNRYIMLIKSSLKNYKENMKSGLSTSYFMKDSEAFSEIPYQKDVLEIQNNIFQTILLKTMSPTVLEYTPQQSIFYNCESVLKDHLQPYLFIEYMPRDKAQKVTEKIVDYVEEFMKITLCETKMKLFDKKIDEAKKQLEELEKSGISQVTEAEADRNAAELCAEIEAEQEAAKAAAKRKKKKRKTSSNKKVQAQQQTKPSKQEKIEKKVEISDEEKSSPLTTPSVLNPDTISTLSLESSDIDPETYETFDIAENDENSQTFLYLDDKISDLKSHQISQHTRSENTRYQHIKYYASPELTKLFMENVYNSKNLDTSIKDKLAMDDDYSHFVGSFLVRFQESKPEATVEDCLNACTEILNNGVVIHSNYKNSRTKLDLYSPKYKTIMPFYVASDNKIHLTTMFIATETNMNSRYITNPIFGTDDKSQSLSKMHEYLSDNSKTRYYYTLQNSIETLKGLQDREYRV
ncbi:MAG: hypothetical protein MRZ90_04225 [Candidatus Gastranaerophilales bacterium]|nr:hypothetical protein [Candidatus Gastranaerophilales bacterium]